MQLDGVTAGAGFVMVQVCIAIVMTGIYRATPHERCTRDWAIAAISVGVGVSLIFLNGGAMRPLVLLLGNGVLLLGVVIQWRGIRAFYAKPATNLTWAVGALLFGIFVVAVWAEADFRVRVLIVSPSLIVLTLLCLYEIIDGQRGQRSFASVLTSLALLMLIATNITRVLVTSSTSDASMLNTTLLVLLAFGLPSGISILLACGLILLYFERLVDDKHKLATHDDLTGVFNRRALMAAGEREVVVARRMGRSLALAFVDVDHFKKINDTHGHEAGDRVLTEIAGVLKQVCRDIDIIGRYGGEELCIILPGTKPADLPVIGQRLVESVGNAVFSHGLQVGISVGLASLQETDGLPLWPRLVNAADKELYKAKAAGRGRYSLATAD